MKYILFIILLSAADISLAQQSYHTKYDDSTLRHRDSLAIMPYNRLVKSSGKVVTYGNPNLENHALDFSILPGNKYIAIEGRFGIAILDVKTQKIKYQWNYENDSRYLNSMSTYCGI